MWRIEALGGIELLQASYGEFVFTPHSHEGYLIAVTEGGVGGPTYRGEKHEVGPGDVLVLNPEEAHAGGPLTDAPWRYRALYPSADLMQGVIVEFPDAGPSPPEFGVGVVRDAEAARRLRRFHLETEEAGSTLLQRESHLTDALVWLTAHHAIRAEQPKPPGREHRAVRRAREYLDEYPGENVSLVGLAGLAGLSPFYLCRIFRSEVGLAPHAYQTQARVRRAKELLREELSVAQAAAEAGFFDQAHLTRHFKRIVGVTPGQYVRSRVR